LRYSNDSIIRNVTLHDNTAGSGFALYIRDSNNITLQDINSIGNDYGIFLSSSSNSNLNNVTANPVLFMVKFSIFELFVYEKYIPS